MQFFPSLHQLCIGEFGGKRSLSDLEEDDARIAKIYGNAEKRGIRDAFAAAARCGPLLYLDDAGANIDDCATAHFLKLGYKQGDLVAVNFNASQCQLLSEKFEVDCVLKNLKSCLEDIASEKKKLTALGHTKLQTVSGLDFSGIWIDLTGYTVDMEMVKLAMTLAKKVVTITFTSQHAQISSDVDRVACAPTDVYANQIMNDIQKMSIVDDAREMRKVNVKTLWKCTSRQVYGSASEGRIMNMINLQFQRKETLNDDLCIDFVANSTVLKRPSRIIENLHHDAMYALFETRHAVLDTQVDYVRISEGSRVGMMFAESPGIWFAGTVVSLKNTTMSKASWIIDARVRFQDGEFSVKLDSFYYLSTPHKSGLSWVLLDSRPMIHVDENEKLVTVYNQPDSGWTVHA